MNKLINLANLSAYGSITPTNRLASNLVVKDKKKFNDDLVLAKIHNNMDHNVEIQARIAFNEVNLTQLCLLV